MGKPILFQQNLIDDILVTFSVDHAIREVKIHEVILLCE